ncbi:MAG TPA: hypothetical protein VIG50_09885 [Vicinamibacteria bacterium]
MSASRRLSRRGRAAGLALSALAGLGCAHRPPGPDAGSRPLYAASFPVAEGGEVLAALTVTCEACSWGEPGREAAVLAVHVDGRYSQDVPLTQGRGPATYRVLLGPLGAGTHRVEVTRDALSAPGAGALTVDALLRPVLPEAAEAAALAHAPILLQRANAVGRFTDVPLLMYYESEPAGGGRTRLLYTVIFSHEDGGTPADRLMATWGRLTDIELMYAVVLDTAGVIVEETYQGREHRITPFRGRREGRHPLLWVVTDNNMVADRGPTRRRYRPAPERADLRGVSREAVMDAHPWTYRVMAEEVRREGRVAESAPLGSGTVADPGRYVFLEGCADVHDAQLAFDVAVGPGATEWVASDGGDARFRVSRGGCFRAAAALPAGASVRALRLRAHTRPPRKGEAPLPAGAGWARLTRVNRLFRLGEGLVPGPDLLRWQGEARLQGEAAGLEIAVPGAP